VCHVFSIGVGALRLAVGLDLRLAALHHIGHHRVDQRQRLQTSLRPILQQHTNKQYQIYLKMRQIYQYHQWRRQKKISHVLLF
jgi:hypothetical protein